MKQTGRTPLDAVLVQQLKAGDESAVAALADLHWSRIYQLALRIVRNHEDAEEVAQDVLLKVCRKIAAFRGDAALSSWIYRITFNTAMSRLRAGRSGRELELPDDLGANELFAGGRITEPVDRSVLPDERYLHGQLRVRLKTALAELPPVCRTPVLLRDIRALSTEEASRALAVKTQTLKTRLHRGRVALRSRLAHFASGLTLHAAN
jgi:RNA polymerase sigma-70 factor, ECF subfamily